jgi:phage replication-related protein YjqB (UPF0714/DUF867 family)
MLDHSDETISIHGYSGEDPIVYVGGKDKKLAKSITDMQAFVMLWH